MNKKREFANSMKLNEIMRIKYYNLFIQQIGTLFMVSINIAVSSIFLLQLFMN